MYSRFTLVRISINLNSSQLNMCREIILPIFRTLAGTFLFTSHYRMELRLIQLLVQQTPAPLFPEIKQVGHKDGSLSPPSAEQTDGQNYTYTHSCSSKICAHLEANFYPCHLTSFSLFSSSFSPFICFPFICFPFILSCSHYPFSLSFRFLYVVSVRPYLIMLLLLLIFVPMARHFLTSQELFIVEASKSQPQRTRQDFSGRVTSPSQSTLPDSSNNQKKYPFLPRDSNLQSQQVNGRISMPQTAHPPRPAIYITLYNIICNFFLLLHQNSSI